MTPSIIRRFAQYHHLDAMFDAPIDDSATTIERLCVLHFGSCDALGVMRLVQTLTLIESAEMLLGDADGLEMAIGPAGRFTTLDEHGSRVLSAAANRLFAQAGIDPAKWREVKE